jgi:hypothetical protein
MADLPVTDLTVFPIGHQSVVDRQFSLGGHSQLSRGLRVAAKNVVTGLATQQNALSFFWERAAGSAGYGQRFRRRAGWLSK